MIYNGIKIDNTFAEAFNMKASRIIVTADNLKWAKHACDSFTGSVSYTHLRAHET